MLHRKYTKKLGLQAGGLPAGELGALVLEQLWNLDGTKGLIVHSETAVSVLAGKAVFLPPKMWQRVYLPFKATVNGGATLLCGLQRQGLIAGLAVTKGGQLRVSVWNSLNSAVYLTPKTIMVNVIGASISIKRFGQEKQKLGQSAKKRVQRWNLIRVRLLQITYGNWS